jgi:catechol 2,3-dioxygenase-like lactoylglutathione lyase family enzyme
VRELADFYHRLLGWSVAEDGPDWVSLKAPGGGPTLSFQLEPDHSPPVWPAVPGEQQMMMHLDFVVSSLDDAVSMAQELGATLAEIQPQHDVRVLLDPAGHPFCLFETTHMATLTAKP